VGEEASIATVEGKRLERQLTYKMGKEEEGGITGAKGERFHE